MKCYVRKCVGVAERTAAYCDRLSWDATFWVVQLALSYLVGVWSTVMMVKVVVMGVVAVVGVKAIEGDQADTSTSVKENSIKNVTLKVELSKVRVVEDALSVNVHGRLTATFAAGGPFWVQTPPKVGT